MSSGRPLRGWVAWGAPLPPATGPGAQAEATPMGCKATAHHAQRTGQRRWGPSQLHACPRRRPGARAQATEGSGSDRSTCSRLLRKNTAFWEDIFFHNRDRNYRYHLIPTQLLRRVTPREPSESPPRETSESPPGNPESPPGNRQGHPPGFLRVSHPWVPSESRPQKSCPGTGPGQHLSVLEPADRTGRPEV